MGVDIDLGGSGYRPVCRVGADYRATYGTKRLSSRDWPVGGLRRIGDLTEKGALRRGRGVSEGGVDRDSSASQIFDCGADELKNFVMGRWNYDGLTRGGRGGEG